MTTALATTTQNTMATRSAYEPNDIDSALKLCQILAESNLLPRSIATPEAAFMVIMHGHELGLSPGQSLRSLRVESGRISMSADLMVALCVSKRDICEHFQLVESTDRIARYVAKRVGQAEVSMSFTIDQAKVAGLTGKDNWKSYPAAMLRARASAALARVVFPDLMLGIYDHDEIPEAREVVAPRFVSSRIESAVVEPAVATDEAPPSDGKPTPVDAAMIEFARVETIGALSKARADFNALKLKLDYDTKAALRDAYDAAKTRIESAETAPAPAADAAPVDEAAA